MKKLWLALLGIAAIAMFVDPYTLRSHFAPGSLPVAAPAPAPAPPQLSKEEQEAEAATKTAKDLEKMAWMIAYGAHCTRAWSEDYRQLIKVGIWANARYGEDRVEAAVRRVSINVTKTRGDRDAFCSTMRSTVDLFLSQLPL